MPDYATVKDAIKRTVHDRFLANGVTTVQEMSETVAGLSAMRELIDSGEMPMRLSIYIHVPGTLPLDRVLAREIGDFEFDDDWMRLGGVKLFIDGGFSARAAALMDPYEGYPEITGKLGYEDRELRRIVRKVHRSGMQLRMHTNGDRALKQLIDCVRDGVRDPGRRGRGLALPSPRRTRWQRDATGRPDHLPPERRQDPARPKFGVHLQRRGVPDAVPGRAAHPPIVPFPNIAGRGVPGPGQLRLHGHRPVAGQPHVRHLVHGQPPAPIQVDLLEPEEGISVAEAIRVYTYNSAYAEFQEEKKGSIETGKLADLAVLDRDPLSTPGEELKEIRVDQTWVDGKLAYRKGRKLGGASW